MEELDRRFNELLSELRDVSNQRRELKGIKERLSLLPLQTESEETAFDFYKLQQKALWTPNEFDYTADIPQYEKLSADQKRLIDLPFAFFSGADSDVISELSFRFLLEVDSFPELSFYLIQLYIETVHAEVYSKLIIHLIPDKAKAEMLLNAVQNYPVIKEIHDWMAQFLTGNYTPIERFAAYACIEGMIFQTPFLFIFYFRTLGLMSNIVFANEQIAKDEGIHADRGCRKVKDLLQSSTQRDQDEINVLNIVDQAKLLVRKFSRFVLTREDDTDVEIPGLTLKSAYEFSSIVANSVLFRMGFPETAMYSVDSSKIPSWMNDIGSSQKANLYERRTGNYSQYAHDESGEDDEDDVYF